MICYLITCNGYKTVRTVKVNSFDELPTLCQQEEERINDEYAVFASHNGEIVAYSDGLAEHWNPDPIYQSGLMYACGYRD